MGDKRRVARIHKHKPREMTDRERIAAWELLPALKHRQYPWGARVPVVLLHRTCCPTYTGGKCSCDPIAELGLPGKN